MHVRFHLGRHWISRGDNPMLPSRAFNIDIISSENETKRLLLSEKIPSASDLQIQG